MAVQALAFSGGENSVMGRRKLVAFLIDIQCGQLFHADSLTEPQLDVTDEIAEPLMVWHVRCAAQRRHGR